MTLHDKITELLAQADSWDGYARASRKRAGELLILAREQAPQNGEWYKQSGLDERTALLLIEQAVGGRTYV